MNRIVRPMLLSALGVAALSQSGGAQQAAPAAPAAPLAAPPGATVITTGGDVIRTTARAVAGFPAQTNNVLMTYCTFRDLMHSSG